MQGYAGSTILRINAEKLQVTGSEETLGIEIVKPWPQTLSPNTL